MSRWIYSHQSSLDDYSHDPFDAADLLDSFSRQNITYFRFLLDVRKCNPNLIDVTSGLTVFETVLQTPKSADFIDLCFFKGAQSYEVRKKIITTN